jgi:hypothetical protein
MLTSPSVEGWLGGAPNESTTSTPRAAINTAPRERSRGPCSRPLGEALSARCTFLQEAEIRDGRRPGASVARDGQRDFVGLILPVRILLVQLVPERDGDRAIPFSVQVY